MVGLLDIDLTHLEGTEYVLFSIGEIYAGLFIVDRNISLAHTDYVSLAIF